MLAKLKEPRIDDATNTELRRFIHRFGSWKEMVVLAINLAREGVFFWFDASSTVIPVPLRLIDIVDGTLSKTWVATHNSDGILLGPPEFTTSSFEGDLADRTDDGYRTYIEVRSRLFAESDAINGPPARSRD